MNLLEMKLVDALEAFAQMVLNAKWIFGLTENMKEVIIREKEKPWKSHSFGVQIVIQTLLDPLNHLVALLEILKESCLKTGIKDIWVLMRALHDVAPELVN